MVAKKVIAPELLAEARRLYEQTNAPVRDIADMVGLSPSKFYERIREYGRRSRRARPTFSLARAVSEAVMTPLEDPSPRQTSVVTVLMDAEAVAQQRVAIAQRLITVADREVDAIERIIAVLKPGDALEAEHSARTLASISRTLRDIALLTRPADETPPDDNDDDPIPHDIDEFRRALAIRIEGLIEARPIGEGAGSGRSEAELD